MRVVPGHPALNTSPYATILLLNTFLQEKLVREIQTTKTGFAISPVSTEAQDKLGARIGDIKTSLSSYDALCELTSLRYIKIAYGHTDLRLCLFRPVGTVVKLSNYSYMSSAWGMWHLSQGQCKVEKQRVTDLWTGARAIMWSMIVDNNSKESTTTQSIYTCIYIKEPYVIRRHCTIN